MSIDPVVEVWEEPITVTIVENSPDVTASDDIVEVSIVEGDATEVVVAADTVVNVIDEPVEVIIDAYADPIVNVYLGGIGGLPGDGSGDYQWFDVASFVKALNGSITKGQLSIDLSTQIDETTTGLAEANINFADAVLNYETGMQAVDAHDSRITTTEDNINLHASRLNVAEGLIQTAGVDITDLAIRTTVAEGSIGSQEARLVAQEELTSNEWTVKIQENVDGSAYTAGVGLMVYPDWLSGVAYALDEFIYHNGVVYKATVAHVADLTNEPPNTNFWVNIPHGVKSQFGVLADSFFVQAPTGDKKVPFLVQNGLVTIDGDLMASGTITGAALSAALITAGHISANSIQAGHISANAIQTSHLAAGQVTASKIAANTITASQIDVASLRAAIISAGTIYADHIVAGNVTTTKINDSAIITSKVYDNAITQNYGASNINAYSLSLVTEYRSPDGYVPVFIFAHVYTQYACQVQLNFCSGTTRWVVSIPAISGRTDGWVGLTLVSRGFKINATATDGITCTAVLSVSNDHGQANYGPWFDASLSIIGCKR